MEKGQPIKIVKICEGRALQYKVLISNIITGNITTKKVNNHLNIEWGIQFYI